MTRRFGRLIDNMEYEVFNFARTYCDLVFPLTTGTYFEPTEIIIKINLGAKSHPQLSQEVDTPLGPWQGAHDIRFTC